MKMIRLYILVIFTVTPAAFVCSQPSVPGIYTLRAGLPLEQKIAIIQRHIEDNHYGTRTIPVCMPYDGGVNGKIRAWTMEDIRGKSVQIFRNVHGNESSITGADWLNNENSAQFSGAYLLSQVYRYQVTKEKAALDECRRAVNGIKAIADLAGPDRFGWICKPFGEKVWDITSPDQNISVVQGLWSFLPYADAAQAQWIRGMLPAIAGYWKRIDYIIVSGSREWDMKTADNTFLRMFSAINLAAYKISRDERFLQESRRLDREFGELSGQSATLFDTFRESRPGYFSDWKKAAEFSINIFAPVHLNILQELKPEKKQDCLKVWERLLDQSLIGYDTEYGAHYYYVEVKWMDSQYHWRPMQLEWPKYSHDDLITSHQLAFTRYPHRIYWPDATSRIPLVYMMYLKNGGKRKPAMEAIVKDIMQKLDYDHLHWMTDPHHDQTIPETDYMLRAFTSEVANYIAAWYLGKQLGFWENSSNKK